MKLIGSYTDETLIIEYYGGGTWNDIPAKYQKYHKDTFGKAAFGSGEFIDEN